MQRLKETNDDLRLFLWLSAMLKNPVLNTNSDSKHLFLCVSHWTLIITLWYLHKLRLLRVAFHLQTCSQHGERFCFFAGVFRQSVCSSILHLSHNDKTTPSVTMSSCFHRAPSSWYSDGLLGRTYTAKCCYQAAEKACWSTMGMKMYRLSAAREITGIFCAPFTVFWFVVSTCLGLGGKPGVVQLLLCARPLSAEPS